MSNENTKETKTALERARERALRAKEAADAAAKRARQARAKLTQVETRQAAPARRADTRRKIILGAVLLAECKDLIPQVVEKMPEVVRKAYEEATARALSANGPTTKHL